MKSNCGKKYEKRASRKKISAYAVGAIIVFTAGTFAPSDRGFAAEKNILETRLRGGVDNPNPAGGRSLPPMYYLRVLACRGWQKGLSPWKIRQARLHCLAS